jgi:hypothetical protein
MSPSVGCWQRDVYHGPLCGCKDASWSRVELMAEDVEFRAIAELT